MKTNETEHILLYLMIFSGPIRSPQAWFCFVELLCLYGPLRDTKKDLCRYDMDRVIITIKYTKKQNLLLQLRQTCPTMLRRYLYVLINPFP